MPALNRLQGFTGDAKLLVIRNIYNLGNSQRIVWFLTYFISFKLLFSEINFKKHLIFGIDTHYQSKLH